MNATGNAILEDLNKFVRNLTVEQADILIAHLPTVIALLEEPMLPCQQEPFLRTG